MSGQEWRFEPGPAPRPPGLWQRLWGWILLAIVIGLMLGGFLLIGNEVYHPESRVPASPQYPIETGLLGTTMQVGNDLDALAELLAGEEEITLEMVGEVHRLAFPRTLLDRSLGERKEVALFFVAATRSGLELSLMALQNEDGDLLLAVERPTLVSGRDDPLGTYLSLPMSGPVDDPLVALGGAALRLLPQVEAAKKDEVSSDDVVVFAAFAFGAGKGVIESLETNLVVAHLVDQLQGAERDVSIAAPVLLVRPAAERGEIVALYVPAKRLVLKPIWGEARLTSLAHELLHAHVDLVLTDRQEALQAAASYLEVSHPRLHRDVVGDLYERLGPTGRAEESLAFLVGAIANRQTKTVATGALLENTGLLSVSESVLRSDIELLIELGLLPSCMDPEAVGYSEPEIAQSYYEAAEAVCAR